jgi:hypothetical protein
MSRRIWRFELTKEEGDIVMPINAEIISVLPCEPRWPTINIWAVVNPMNKTEHRHLRVTLTGQSLPDRPLLFLTTFLFQGVIYHVFEDPKR